MNVLFLFVSLPNLDTSNNIFASLIKEFKNQGHNVFVSTKGDSDKPTKINYEADIPVLRIKSHDFTGVKSSIKKALAYQEYTIKQTYKTYKEFKNNKIDLIISHSLPPELAFTTNYLKKKFNCKLYLIQTDYIWQDAVAFNYFSQNSIIAKYYQFWESKMFNSADYIGCPTMGNIDFIKYYYPNIDSSKFRFLPFWQKPIDITHANADLVDEYKDKFKVVYGGSIGAAQRVDRIIDLAEQCDEYKDIIFIIMGKGAYLEELKKMVDVKKLSNVIFKQHMPQEQFLNFLSSCDVGIVILNEKIASPNFPSKTLSYMNMKIPILAALDHCTDFGKYLEDNGAGLWCYSDDVEGFKINLLKYYNSPELRTQVKVNGYNLFINNLTPIHAYNTIVKDLL